LDYVAAPGRLLSPWTAPKIPAADVLIALSVNAGDEPSPACTFGMIGLERESSSAVLQDLGAAGRTGHQRIPARETIQQGPGIMVWRKNLGFNKNKDCRFLKQRNNV